MLVQVDENDRTKARGEKSEIGWASFGSSEGGYIKSEGMNPQNEMND